MARRRSYFDGPYYRHLIESNLNRTGVLPVSVRVHGKVRSAERGLYNDNCRFAVTGRGVAGEIEDCHLFLRLIPQPPRYRSESEGRRTLMREAETLERLQQTDFPYQAPRLLCVVEDHAGTVVGLIETCLDGIPLDHYRTSSRGLDAIGWIGQVAAAVHRLPPEKFRHLPAYNDSRAHVLARLEELPDELYSAFPAAQEARAWILEHLPDRPSCVVHGDLLPQNVLHDAVGEKDLGVVDWEFAQRGDAAHDLAIVSRGGRKILGKQDGLKWLLDAYRNAGGQKVSVDNVRSHELLLIMGWIREAEDARRSGTSEGHAPEQYVAQLKRIMRTVRSPCS
jgi:aminoglycoside phosphotransferase (APT) family kinase protein